MKMPSHSGGTAILAPSSYSPSAAAVHHRSRPRDARSLERHRRPVILDEDFSAARLPSYNWWNLDIHPQPVDAVSDR